MIAECAADILAKVKTVPDFTTASGVMVGLSIGGRSSDPGMLKIPLPAAWVTLKSDQTDEQDYTHGPASGLIPTTQGMLATYAVMVFVPYIDDDDLLDTQYPLLEAVASAVHGTESPSGLRWRYIGQRIALVYPDRLAYEQRFTLNFPITTSDT